MKGHSKQIIQERERQYALEQHERERLLIEKLQKELEGRERILKTALRRDDKFMIGAQLYWMRANWKPLDVILGYKKLNDYAKDVLGYKKSEISNMILIAETFCTKGPEGFPSGRLMKEYRDYDFSQLNEMRSMTPEQLAMADPAMAVRDIKRLRIPVSERTTSQQVYDIAVKLPRNRQQVLLEVARALRDGTLDNEMEENDHEQQQQEQTPTDIFCQISPD